MSAPAAENTCPICDEPAPQDGNKAFPFCSSRCRLLDLGKWLDGDYRIPGNEVPPDADPE